MTFDYGNYSAASVPVYNSIPVQSQDASDESIMQTPEKHYPTGMYRELEFFLFENEIEKLAQRFDLTSDELLDYIRQLPDEKTYLASLQNNEPTAPDINHSGWCGTLDVIEAISIPPSMPPTAPETTSGGYIDYVGPNGELIPGPQVDLEGNVVSSIPELSQSTPKTASGGYIDYVGPNGELIPGPQVDSEGNVISMPPTAPDINHSGWCGTPAIYESTIESWVPVSAPMMPQSVPSMPPAYYSLTDEQKEWPSAKVFVAISGAKTGTYTNLIDEHTVETGFYVGNTKTIITVDDEGNVISRETIVVRDTPSAPSET